ncbi:hypothetical protein LBMAG56_40350 [Verrucomicrobiota bacterium]|nr:hypothetical protein LBMAG56_40350 [Verrucomicrobiota bacterium]
MRADVAAAGDGRTPPERARLGRSEVERGATLADPKPSCVQTLLRPGTAALRGRRDREPRGFERAGFER